MRPLPITNQPSSTPQPHIMADREAITSESAKFTRTSAACRACRARKQKVRRRQSPPSRAEFHRTNVDLDVVMPVQRRKVSQSCLLRQVSLDIATAELTDNPRLVRPQCAQCRINKARCEWPQQQKR